MPDTPDHSLHRLEHDHHHLTRLVADLRASFQATIRGEQDHDALHEALESFLAVAQDDLFEHFNREEEVLFPWIIEQQPQMSDRILRLETAHDRMCGVLMRLQNLVDSGPESLGDHLDVVLLQFTRFDAYFSQHAVDEGALLEDLRTLLTPEQRTVIAELLAEL